LGQVGSSVGETGMLQPGQGMRRSMGIGLGGLGGLGEWRLVAETARERASGNAEIW
jgi:hypothetical protein